MMSNLIAKVSHNSRCAPLRTVNFAIKPPRPVAMTGGTPSSGMIADMKLILCPPSLNSSRIRSEIRAFLLKDPKIGSTSR